MRERYWWGGVKTVTSVLVNVCIVCEEKQVTKSNNEVHGATRGGLIEENRWDSNVVKGGGGEEDVIVGGV